MTDSPRELAYCHACGGAMDVTEVAPFSNVVCPACKMHTRVKREFGPYTLLRRHAIGGMSLVFVAHDNALDREVAVKILNEQFSADENRIAAFEQEARLTASISHPHVVRLFTTGRAFGHFYLAMEFVSGGHLEHVIRESGAMPEARVLQLALQVADGLRAAHAAGLIHRDIKPGNILLDGEGNAKIVDFGLALVTQGGRAKATEVWATPYYVPPEAVEGRAEDFRSDLYAFGATLYHALAGTPPCKVESMSTALLREAKKHIVPLAQAAPWLSAETCAVVERTMAYHPVARYRSYEELIAALQSALQHVTSVPQAQPVPTGRQVRHIEPPRQKKIKLPLVAVVAGAALAAGIGLWFAFSPKGQPDAANGTNGNAGGAGNFGIATPPGEDPVVAVRIGRDYRAARASLELGDYQKAEKRFDALLEDHAVKEPTASWAGFEATLAALLDGRGDAARSNAKNAIDHIKICGASVDPAVKRLSVALQKLRELPSVSVDEATRELDDPPGVMTAIAYALKDWEQGRLTEAKAIFTAIRQSPLIQRDEWLASYRSIVDRYLSDHALIEELSAKKLPADDAACDALSKEFESAMNRLQTQGRARFHLRCLMLDLARHRKEISQRPQPTDASTNQVSGDAYDIMVKEVEAALTQVNLAGALAALKKADPPQREKRDAWLYLTESAAAFLSRLEEEAASQPVQGMSLSRRDATTTYDKITGSKTGGLLLAAGDAPPGFVPWADLTPDSVIAVHQRLVSTNAGPAEQLRRHEQAIAFDYLLGDRKRAMTAAARLAETSQGFGERWEDAMKALQK